MSWIQQTKRHHVSCSLRSANPFHDFKQYDHVRVVGKNQTDAHWICVVKLTCPFLFVLFKLHWKEVQQTAPSGQVVNQKKEETRTPTRKGSALPFFSFLVACSKIHEVTLDGRVGPTLLIAAVRTRSFVSVAKTTALSMDQYSLFLFSNRAKVLNMMLPAGLQRGWRPP